MNSLASLLVIAYVVWRFCLEIPKWWNARRHEFGTVPHYLMGLKFRMQIAMRGQDSLDPTL